MRKPMLALALAALTASFSAVAMETLGSFGRGEVKLEIQASARKVSPAEDLELSLILTHPEDVAVELPSDFAPHIEGFSILGSYEGESLVAGGTRRRSIHLRARPAPAAERYRLAPFPVRIHSARSTAGEQWFPTAAIRFEDAGILSPGEEAPRGVVTDLKPVRIRPSARAAARVAVPAILALAGLFLLLRSLGWIRERVRIARLAPRERALHELRELLKRDLPGKGKTKEFFVRLTAIVRRYIERGYEIRAHRQTTEEFLRDAAGHPAFKKETLARLREFLDSADLVKFADVAATEEIVAGAVDSARSYLESEPAKTHDPRKEGAR